MDYYNNYYEELYHAGLFSALRGRIRDGHKWITRTGTPGHYVYTYAKDLAGKARSMFGKPRGMFGTRKTASASKSTWKESGSSNSGTNDWHDSQRKDAEEGKRDDRFVDRTAKGLAKRDANTGRNVGKMTTSIGDSSPSYVNDSGERASRKHVNYTQYEDGDKKKVTRTDYNTRNTTYRNGITVDGSRAGQTSNTSFNTREYNLPIKKKSAADRIKEWGANTLSSIRKTANDAAGAVSKGYESAKNWVNDLQKKARGASWNNLDLKNGHAGLTESKPKGWDEYYNSAKNRETGKDRPNVRANASHNTKENRHIENVKRELRELAIEDHNQRQAARTGEALLSLANSNNRNFDEWKPSKAGRVVSTTTDKKGTTTKKYGDGNVLEYDSKPVTVSNMDEWRKKYYEPAMSGTNSNKKRRRTGNR